MPPRVPSSLSRLFCIKAPTSARCLQTSRPGHAPLTVDDPSQSPVTPLLTQHTQPVSHIPSNQAALACLPLSQVLRTYLITSVSSSPTLLAGSSRLLSSLLSSRTWLTDVEKNPLIKLALRETFYKQFCAGETKPSARECMNRLQNIGYHGVILEYALEVLKDAQDVDEAKDVEVWRKGLLETVDMARPGDSVGLKWSGLGVSALQLLKAEQNPSPLMDSAMREVCDAASAKTVHLLPAAEEVTTTPTIDKWSLNLQRHYNRGPAGAIVYNTYQAYLRHEAGVLNNHLADAQREGYTLGIKLVRGAYLSTDPRHMIWGSKEDTDAAYDSIASALLKQRYEGPVQLLPGTDSKTFPQINLVLATHNAASARKAQAIRKQQVEKEVPLVPLIYAQLQGMADEVSCELLREGRQSDALEAPRVFKCTTWGTMKECLNYLLRRAAENKDAAMRTQESRVAMGQELRRRVRVLFGLA